MLIYRLELLEVSNSLSCFLRNLLYGRLVLQPGVWFRTDSISKQKTVNNLV